MSDNARGGNDRLVSGHGNENLWGDAATMTGHAVGGNDAFVFEASSGHDRIHDFQQGKDQIEVGGYAASSFADLAIETTAINGDPVSIVHFDANNDVTVFGSITLQASDFDFV